jgi:hypothetical protein
LNYGEWLASALKRGVTVVDSDFSIERPICPICGSQDRHKMDCGSSYPLNDLNVTRVTHAVVNGQIVGYWNHWHKRGAFF